MKHCRNIGPLHKGPRRGSLAEKIADVQVGLNRELLERRAAERGSRMLLDAILKYFDKRSRCIASKATMDRVQAMPKRRPQIEIGGDLGTGAEGETA